MKKLSIVAVLILSLTSFGRSQVINGNGKLKKQVIEVAKFTHLQTFSCVNLIVSKAYDKVEIEADENLIALIDIKNTEGVLTIKDANKVWFESKNILKIYLPAQDLTRFENFGSGNISFEDELQTPTLSFKNEGSGNINLRLSAEDFEFQDTGSGNISIEGQTQNLRLVLQGSGNFNGKQLKTNDARIEMSGSGNAQVRCVDNMNVTISGTGNFGYLGKPKIFKQLNSTGKLFSIAD